MLRVALLSLVLFSPYALASPDSIFGSGVGMRVGSGGAGLGSVGVEFGESYVAVWQAFWWNATAGARTLDLSWVASPPPMAADYDLRLYKPGTLDDNQVKDTEILAASQTRAFSPRTERITYTVPTAGLYVVMVMPVQAQDERFTLASSDGDLAFAAEVPAFQSPRVVITS